MSVRNSESSNIVTVKQCTVLGGAGYPFLAGDSVDLQFGLDMLSIQSYDGTSADIPYLELVNIAISGPGSITTGGSFAGGGFGVEGALEGMAVATVLNLLTSRTKIHTFIALVTHLGELHLHYGDMEPGALRIALSEVFTSLRRLDPIWLRARLELLEERRARQLISDSDFERLKQRLFVPPKPDFSERMVGSTKTVEPRYSQESINRAKEMAASGSSVEEISRHLQDSWLFESADAIALAKSVKGVRTA